MSSSSADFYGSVEVPNLIGRRNVWPEEALPFLGRMSIPISINYSSEGGVVVLGNGGRIGYVEVDNLIRQFRSIAFNDRGDTSMLGLWNFLTARTHEAAVGASAARRQMTKLLDCVHSCDDEFLHQLCLDVNMKSGWCNKARYKTDTKNRRCFIPKLCSFEIASEETCDYLRAIARRICPEISESEPNAYLSITRAFMMRGMDESEARKEVRRIERELRRGCESVYVSGDRIVLSELELVGHQESVGRSVRRSVSLRVEIEVRLNVTALKMVMLSHGSEMSSDWRVDTQHVVACLVKDGLTRDSIESEAHQYTCETRAHLEHVLKDMHREHRIDTRMFSHWSGYNATPNGVLTNLETPVPTDYAHNDEPIEEEGVLRVALRPYQRQNVRWMVERENRSFAEDMWVHVRFSEDSVHEFSDPEPVEESGVRLRNMTSSFMASKFRQGFYYSPLLHLFTDELPQDGRGGFLADEMGMGKTVSMLAVVAREPRSLDHAEDGGTLVVCDVSLIGQWADEIVSKCAQLSVHVYHGPRRIRDTEMLKGFDVVITSYSTLASDSRRTDDRTGPLQNLNWHRIVADESHKMRNGSRQTQILCGMHARIRWCLSGTPLCADVFDAFWQLRFLQASFVMTRSSDASRSMFLRLCRSPISDSTMSSSVWKMSYLMRRMMIRHHKNQKTVGDERRSIIDMPPLSEEVHSISLSATERQAYDAAEVRQREIFRAASRMGNILQVLSTLDPLRRYLSNGRDVTSSSAFDLIGGAPEEAVERPVIELEVQEMQALIAEQNCAICLDTLDQPCRTECNHHFCRDCLETLVEHGGSRFNVTRCPMCRRRLERFSVLSAPRNEDAMEVVEEEDGAQGEEGRDPTSFSKTRFFNSHVTAILEADPTAKILVFSQYMETLSTIETQLKEQGIGFRTLTGKMTRVQRTKALQAFHAGENRVPVFLLSVRAGAVGINLTAANHVIIYEPCINTALESQAIGRAWRMGQAREVKVHRYVVNESVESRMFARRTRLGNVMESTSEAVRGSVRGETRHISPDYVRYALRA